MKKEKPFPTAISFMIGLMLLAASVVAYGHHRSIRSADQCAELLASFKRLEAKAEAANGIEELKPIAQQMENVVRRMRSLRCTNTPDYAVGQPQSREDMQGTVGPGGEGGAEYEELPERRSQTGFRAFVAEAQVDDMEPAAGACRDLSGTWRITTSEGSFTWKLWNTERDGEGSLRIYGGRESGKRNGRGFAALLRGNVLRLQFDVETSPGETFGGTYNCQLDADCRSSLSPCKLTYDLNRTGSVKASFERQQE